jgi:sugar (pentulose or hexulose) kinase
MAYECFLSLDIGTSFCKAVLYTPSGEIREEVSVPCEVSTPIAGWIEQAPESWITASRTAMKAVCARTHCQVKGIGLSGRMGTILHLDSRYRPLSTAILYADTRGASYRVELMERGLVNTLGVSLLNILPKIMWMRTNRPDLFQQTRVVCGAKDYVGLWLTGILATDYSNGPGGTDWPEEIALTGISPELFPPLLPPTATLGGLMRTRAEEIGLPTGTPVIIGASDGACANIGTGAFVPGSACLSLSTTGVIRLATSDSPEPSQIASLGGFCYPLSTDIWLWGGLVSVAGAALAWLADICGDSVSIERLSREAADAPLGSAGLLFLPYLQGMQSPQFRPDIRGMFHNLALMHKRHHLARAVMEGVAYSIRAVADALKCLSGPISSWSLTGGAARDKLWRQIIADVLELPLIYRMDGSPLGAAMLAACGVGTYGQLDEAAACMLQKGEKITPSPDAVQYATHYAHFRNAIGLEEQLIHAPS